SGWIAVIYQFIPGLILRFETVGLFQAVCWIPGFYWACGRAVAAGGGNKWREWIRWTLFAIAQIAFMYLAGSSQIAFYTLVGGVFYIGASAAMGPNPKERAFFGLGTFLLSVSFGAILASIQLMPTSVLATFSYRFLEADFQYYRMGTWITLPRLASLFMFPAVKSPSEMLDYVSSLGYIGLLPVVFIAMTLSIHRRYMNPILPAFFLAFFGTILAFGFNISAWHDLITYPGFNLFRALGRMILPTVVALFGLAAFSLDAMFRGTNDDIYPKWLKAGAWGGMIVSTGLVVWYIFSEGFPISPLETIGLGILLIMAIIVAVGLSGFFITGNRKWLVGLLSVWLAMHLVGMYPLKSAITVNRSAFNRMTEIFKLDEIRSEIGESRPPRILSVDRGDDWDPLLMRLGKNPFKSGDTLPLPALGNEFALGKSGTLNGYTPLVNWRWHEVANEYASRGLRGVEQASGRLRNVLALMNVDAIVAPENFTGGEGFDITGANMKAVLPMDWHLVKTPTPVDFASVPKYVEVWDGSAWDAFKHWITQDGYIPGEWVVVEAPLSMTLPDGMEWDGSRTVAEEFVVPVPVTGAWELDANSNCEIVSVEREINSIKIGVKAQSPFWLVVRESFFPGWKAWIDEEETIVVPADYLFCAIPVPSGEHEIFMRYITPGFPNGMIFSSIGWIIWIIALLATFSGKRKKASESNEAKAE
ncbi:MAG TPA: hypothetical protein ENN67_03920, partial [Firmicutes bacterium]|nr:hypothetical protein [Bacillota bacterium]